jgi:hypothetical protein
MGQVNVNAPGDGGDRSGAAGVNLVAVIIALLLIVVVLWLLFAGPLAGVFGGGGSGAGTGTSPGNVNVKVEVPTVAPQK